MRTSTLVAATAGTIITGLLGKTQLRHAIYGLRDVRVANSLSVPV